PLAAGARTPRSAATSYERAPLATVEGRYTRTRAGFGFAAVEGEARARFPRDLFLPEGMEGEALHGDRVRAEVLRHDRETHRASGRVVEVVRASVERIVGVLDDALR